MLAELGRATLNYEIDGPDDAPVVMFSHSLCASLHMWDPQVTAFAERYRVVRYEMRGHGKSLVSESEFEIEDLAADAVALMDHLGLSTVHWVGLSMGGMIGQVLGLQYADRVKSLALCSTTSRMPKEMGPIWEGRIAAAREGGLPSMVNGTLERWFTQGCRDRNDPLMEPIRGQIASTPTEAFVQCCGAISRLDLTDRLSAIETPTIVVPGRHDPSTTVEASEIIAERIPGSRLTVIEDASHLANVEQPDVWTATVLGWIDENA